MLCELYLNKDVTKQKYPTWTIIWRTFIPASHHFILFSSWLDFPPGSRVPVVEGLNLGFSLTVHVMIKVHSTFPVRISNQVFYSKCIYLCVLRPEKDFSSPWIDLRADGAEKSVFPGSNIQREEKKKAGLNMKLLKAQRHQGRDWGF